MIIADAVMVLCARRLTWLRENAATSLVAAVYHGGPRWSYVQQVRELKVRNPDGTESVMKMTVKVPKVLSAAEPMKPDTLQRIQKLIREKSPSLEELKNLK